MLAHDAGHNVTRSQSSVAATRARGRRSGWVRIQISRGGRSTGIGSRVRAGSRSATSLGSSARPEPDNTACSGLFTTAVLMLAVVTAPAYALGLFGGSSLFGLASERAFRMACYGLIALAALTSLPIFDGVLR